MLKKIEVSIPNQELQVVVTKEALKNKHIPSVRYRRQRVTPMSMSTYSQQTYRISFSSKNTGRYFRSSKKQIRWTFGFTSLTSQLNGTQLRVRRGEEHEVELYWSKKSRKMRLFWNKRNISNLFPEGNHTGRSEFLWETPTGKRLQVIALTGDNDGGGQYDLRIDGISFLELPSLTDLPAVFASLNQEQSTNQVQKGRGPGEQASENSLHQNPKYTFECDDADGLDLRLSLGGLNQHTGETFEDELHSNLYSSILEDLRLKITECLPQAEELVSRAIMSAFTMEGDTLSSDHSHFTMRSVSETSLDTDPYQVEVDMLCCAYDFSRRHVYGRPVSVATKNALKYFQRLICTVFVAIRTEDLTSEAAARIILSVACVLDLKFANSIRFDTCLLVGLPPGTRIEDLDDTLGGYGHVLSPAIALRDVSFGFCRFTSEESLGNLMADAKDGGITIKGVAVQVLALSEDPMDIAAAESHLTINYDEDLDQFGPDEFRATSPVSVPQPSDPLATCHLEDALRPPVHLKPEGNGTNYDT